MEEPEGFDLLAQIEQKRRELDDLRHALAMRRPALSTVCSLTVLKCRIGEVRVALRVDQLSEVVAMPRVTSLPGAPAWVCGTLRIGPEQLTVIDLVALETNRRRRLTHAQFLAVWAPTTGPHFACVVDEVLDFASIEVADVGLPPETTPFAPHVVGVVSLAEGTFLLVDADPLIPPAPNARQEAP